jgi:hypothetical protein
MNAEIVYLRTKAGRIHKAALIDGLLLTHEADNLDDAKREDRITAEQFAAAPLESRCRRCFRTRDIDD